MNRRFFLKHSGLLAFIPMRAVAEIRCDARACVADIAAEIAERRAANRTMSNAWIADALKKIPDLTDRRIAAFELVQTVPYKLTSWNGDPDSLFQLDRGDCRHKSAALLALFRRLDVTAYPITIVFDWADLPVPKDILSELGETRGFHDAIEAQINGNMVLTDPTWDPALAAVGFPVASSWNGHSPTPPITPRATTILREADTRAETDLYAKFGIRWPQRQRTRAFNRAFNEWTDALRRGSAAARG